MAGTVVTISPLMHVAEIVLRTRARVERDGVAELAAATADRRQVAHLRRVGKRLAADKSLECYLADRTDGATYLTVFAAGQKHRPGVMGDARTDARAEDPDGDYWSVPKPPAG